jgi:hypothetical protein
LSDQPKTLKQPLDEVDLRPRTGSTVPSAPASAARAMNASGIFDEHFDSHRRRADLGRAIPMGARRLGKKERRTLDRQANDAAEVPQPLRS